MTSSVPTLRAPGRAAPWPVGVVLALGWLAFGIGLHPLILPEEGRYVGVAWEMIRSGDWIVPTEDGLPFFHKPPLFYWITALSMKLFGVHAAAARLAPLLGASVGAFGLHRFIARRASETLACATTLVLVTMPFFFAGAQFANLDMLVAACIALTIVAAADAAFALQRGEPHARAVVLAWGCAALGVLAKGLIGLVLPGLVIVVWLVATRQGKTILRLLAPSGIAVFALIAAPWFIAVQQQYPDFARYFFIHQHFERFAAGGFNNAEPWWFLIVALLALTLPWSIWLARARRGAVPDDGAALRLLMWIWLAVIVGFFSLPQSKPVGYVMPALFPLAFLIAEPVRSAFLGDRRRLRLAAVASAALALAIGIGAVAWAALRYDRDNTTLAHTLREMRAPTDPVVFVGEYFFDVPLHARLTEPVPVIDDWPAAAATARDNWRRELAEAAMFAPQRAATLLVDRAHGFALRCGGAPLWALAKLGDESILAALPDAARVAASKHVALWRLAPRACDTAPSPALRP